MTEFTAIFIERGLFSVTKRGGRDVSYLTIICATEEEAWSLRNYVDYKGWVQELNPKGFKVYWPNMTILKVMEKLDLTIDHPKIKELLTFEVMNS